MANFLSKTLSRLLGAGIEGNTNINRSTAKWYGRTNKIDWRVKLQVPVQAPELYNFFFGRTTSRSYNPGAEGVVEHSSSNPILEPLRDHRGIIFPLTPTVMIQHSANYNALAQTHSNQPFQAYQNSQADAINVLGEFPVQNWEDAQHWVATLSFLRTASKMFFGADDNNLKGNPPPILHLSGYGDHTFNKVPVVINTFNVELPAGIDYISTKQDSQTKYNNTGRVRKTDYNASMDPSIDATWAPTLSTISMLLLPAYSRDSMKNFSMSKFVRGDLSGKGENEIGFI